MNAAVCRARLRWKRVSLLAGVCLLAGCHHKQVTQLVLPQATPVPLATDSSANQAVLQAPAKPKLPEVPVAAAAGKPKRLRRKTTPKPATQTASGVTLPSSVGAETAPAVVSAASTTSDAGLAEQHGPLTEAAASTGVANSASAVIGSLSVGDEQNPQTRREVVDLLAANERRLTALPVETVRSQSALVSKVRTFQRDARQALDSGDAEGARTLATKGKLLLDDLVKPVS